MSRYVSPSGSSSSTISSSGRPRWLTQLALACKKPQRERGISSRRVVRQEGGGRQDSGFEAMPRRLIPVMHLRGALSALLPASSTQVATRKGRSTSSFDGINRAASLFIAWMKTQPDLQEEEDRKDDSIFYPSSFKVTCDSWRHFFVAEKLVHLDFSTRSEKRKKGQV